MIQFFKRYVFHNLALKLFSLLLAVALWLAIAGEPVGEIAFSVPVEFHNVPQNLEISSETIPQAQVRVRASEHVLRGLSPGDLHVVLDLRELKQARAGEKTFELTPAQIQAPHGAEVVQILPAYFHLSFDQRASRTVELRPRVTGRLASGFQIVRIESEPRAVVIVGPEKRVQKVENATTDPVDATGVAGRTTFLTRAYVTDPLVRLGQPSQVRVTVVTGKISAPGEAETPAEPVRP